MQVLSEHVDKLIQGTIAGDELAFRELHDLLEDPKTTEQRDLLLEKLPINAKSNTNTLVVRALILLEDVPSRTPFQLKEAEMLISRAAAAKNPVALVHKAVFLMMQNDPDKRYEGISLLKRSAMSEEPFALVVGMRVFDGQNIDDFNDLITLIDAELDANRPTSRNT